MYYNSLNNHLKERFGCKVYKLALQCGYTCPNRDGKIDTRGCIFCSQKGSGNFAEPFCESVYSQIEKAKLILNKKIQNGKYIAYFQSFTNTYGEPCYLEKIFTEAINHPDVVALSIATRPDCLGNEILAILKKLNTIKPVWVELGLQTAKPSSVEYIRRGFKNEVYVSAIKSLKAIGVEVITHVILGLPNEDKSDILKTVCFAANSGTDGIKLQLLHVLKNTDLQKDFENNAFSVLSLDEYIDILCDCIEVLPPHIVIHRLTGDGDKKELIAPLWSADKKNVLNKINKALNERNIVQGSKEQS
ncbi:MAG: TIGR01212 family radical SAM protein [Ruminococcaceae bacterium]|nr:TIGR01212 family radical SAM protein [Oscillospiraceae bacterium]